MDQLLLERPLLLELHGGVVGPAGDCRMLAELY